MNNISKLLTKINFFLRINSTVLSRCYIDASQILTRAFIWPKYVPEKLSSVIFTRKINFAFNSTWASILIQGST